MGRWPSWRLITLLPLAASCQFIVPELAGVDDAGPPADLTGIDFFGVDLAGLDFAMPPMDLVPNPTMDLNVPPDQLVVPDLSPPPVVVQAVQTGICAIAPGMTDAMGCVPPLLSVADPARSVLFFQATSAETSCDSSLVRCRLMNANLISCERLGNGAAGVSIRWQVATFSSGVRVQHLEPTCPMVAGPVSTITFNAVNPSETFLLLSISRNGGNISSDDMRTVQLIDATTATITSVANCAATVNMALQVVEVSGAQVTRGVVGPMAATMTMLPASTVSSAAANRSMLLYSWRSSAGDAEMCERMVRGEMTGANTIVFQRGDGNTTTCATQPIELIAYERVELPASFRVQQVTTALPNAMGMAMTPITPVANTLRTLVFAGGQWSTGQGIGEGSLDNMQIFGAMVADHSLASNSSLQLIRASSLGSARFTSYVVELPP